MAYSQALVLAGGIAHVPILITALKFADNNTLKLTEREMEIIFFLNENKDPQKINDLQNKVWGYSSDLETNTVETHIYRLRKKIYDNFKDERFIISTDKGYFIE